MIVYIDNDYKCHVLQEEGMIEVDIPFFDNKCNKFIEGHRHIPEGKIWMREDGIEFQGGMTVPWKDIHQYDDEQLAYEYNLLSQYEEALSSIEQALEVS